MKKIALIGLIIIIALAGFSFNDGIHKSVDEPNTVNLTNSNTQMYIKLSDIAENFKSSNTEGTYMDASSSIKEMRKASDLVVIGKVTKTEQVSEFSIGSTVAVEKAIKGNCPDEISVVALTGDNMLETNGEYVLFLGIQDETRDDLFFVKGGIQGVIKKENNNTIYIKDTAIKKDFMKVKKNSKNSNEWDTITEYIAQ